MLCLMRRWIGGEGNLRMSKLKEPTFEISIIERYKRREISPEEALIEMYLAGVSISCVKDISEALRGTKVSPLHDNGLLISS